MDDGWFTVKKRGRDDDRIAADRAQALDARRSRKGLPSKKKKAAAPPAKKTKATKKKKKARRKTKTEERLDSMVGFIINSSEDEDEWNSDEESEEDELDDVALAEDDDDDDDDEEEPEMQLLDDTSDDETLFPSYQKKKRSKQADGKPPAKKPAAAKKKGGRLKKASNSKKQLRQVVTNDSLSSDDDMDESKTSKYFSKKKDWDDDSSDSDAMHSRTPRQPKQQPKSVLEHHALEDTPMEEEAIRKKPAKKSKNAKKGNEKQFSEFSVGQDDYCSDPDEAIALIAAQEESLKEASKSSPAAAAAAAAGSSTQDVVDLLQDSSSDEEQGDEKDDGYIVDEEAEAASSVLQTADELSAKIIKTMAGWSESAVDGMIVDGALSVSTLSSPAAAASTEASEHTWISAETMREILPRVKLADYQLIGVNWLALLHGMKCVMKGGNQKSQYTNVNGILADEMGLGKTVQTISFLSWLKHCESGDKKKPSSTGLTKEDAVELDDSDGEDVGDDDDDEKSVGFASGGEATHPHLVIAPASVLSNWKIEFEKFAPDLEVVKYHGTMEERMQLQLELRQFLPGKKKRPGAGVDVILAPITYFQKEKSDDRSFLRKFAWNYMIVDEGHVLKNAKGLRYKSLDNFSTMHRLLLTGTPVQNSPKELLSLLCFLMPLFKRSSGADFDDERNKNDGGESMLQHFVSLESGGTGKSDYQAAFRKLKKLFSPFVLRRRKDDVLSQIMPPKEKKVEMVELDAEARLRYNSVIENHLNAKKKGSAAAKDHLFTQLRKAAHHPLMLRSRYTEPAQKQHLEDCFYKFGAFRGEACTKERVAEELEKFNDFDIHLTALELVESNRLLRDELDRYILQEDDLFSSAKFVRLQKLLPELIDDGHRILIFSVWTTCLDLLSCLLEQMGLDYLRMDGQTAVSDRQSLIDKFNHDSTIPIFLLSTKACGLGINLTAADTCIMHDLDFNPFNDLQAEDRCHRIGQTKKVSIIKLVSKDTVDEDIYDMQQRKALMNSAIMDNEDDFNKNAADVKKLIEQTAITRYRKSTAAAGATNSKGIAIEKENALEPNEDEDVEEDL